MSGKLRWLWLLGGAVVVGALLGWGVSIAWSLLQDQSIRHLKAGEEAYAAGQEAFDSGDAETAVEQFDRALDHAEKALAELKKARGDQVRVLPPEKAAQLSSAEGRAFWLKARTLLGRELARLRLAGKPLPPLPAAGDQTPPPTLDNFLVTHIPDDDKRVEAIVCLRQAALRLPAEEAIQRHAMAVEVAMRPLHWKMIPKVASNLLAIDPDDPRALYLMARFEFEQPVTDFSGPKPVFRSTSWDKRSIDRLKKAQAYLDHLTQVEQPPRWRTIYLQARLLQCLRDRYTAGRTYSPVDVVQTEAKLRVLLLDPSEGIWPRAEADENLARLNLSPMDREGIVGCHRLALDVVLKDRRRPKNDPERATDETVLTAAKALIGVCQQLATDRAIAPRRLGELAEIAVTAAIKAQPYLALQPTPGWKPVVQAVEDLAKRAAQRNAGSPELYARLANLLSLEADFALKQGQTAQVNPLHDRVVEWLDTGLRIGRAKQLDAEELLPLHEMAARFKTATVGKYEAVAPHLRALERSHRREALATAYLLEGMLSEQEGRFEHARQSLEKAVRLGGHAAVRAHFLLSSIYLALGLPDKSLASLAEVERAYEQIDHLPEAEQLWLREFVRSREELTLMQLRAQLQRARRRYEQLGRPDLESLPPDSPVVVRARRALDPMERRAETLLQKLPADSSQRRAGRILFVNYALATGQLKRAEKRLAELRRDYPNEDAVRWQELVLWAEKARRDGRIPAADEQVRSLVDTATDRVRGRLLWAGWLILTGRSELARDFLADAALQSALANDPTYDRIRAVAELTSAAVPGRLLPSENRLLQSALHLLRLEPSRATVEDLLPEVDLDLSRSEQRGMIRCVSANGAFGRGDFIEAARHYAGSYEYRRVRPIARRGLWLSLFLAAEDNPEKVELFLREEMLPTHYRNPELLSCYAYACFLLDRLGNPSNPGAEIRDMSSALAALIQALTARGEDPVAGYLLSAQYWLAANRDDIALDQVNAALKTNPEHVEALYQAAALCVDSSDPVTFRVGQRYLGLLKSIEPASPRALVLDGRFAERERRTIAAEKTYRQVITDKPDYADAYARLIRLLTQQDRVDDALAVAQAWRERKADSIAAVQAEIRLLCRAGREAAAEARGREFLNRSIARAKQRAKSLAAGRTLSPEELERRIEQAVAQATATVEPKLIRSFIAGGAWTLAEQWLDRLLQRQPDSEVAVLLQGDLYYARYFDSTDPAAKTVWADKARTAYWKIYGIHKGHVHAGTRLARLMAEQGIDLDEALQILDEVRLGRYTRKPLPVARIPADILDTWGRVYRRLNDPTRAREAIALFEAATKRYPNDPRMYLHLGYAWLLAGDRGKASQMFAAAIRRADPRSLCRLEPDQQREVLELARAEQRRLLFAGRRAG